MWRPSTPLAGVWMLASGACDSHARPSHTKPRDRCASCTQFSRQTHHAGGRLDYQAPGDCTPSCLEGSCPQGSRDDPPCPLMGSTTCRAADGTLLHCDLRVCDGSQRLNDRQSESPTSPGAKRDFACALPI